MLEHKLAQYYDTPIIDALLYAVSAELDELESAFNDLKYKRWIDTGEGVQLDGIGTILNRPRKIDKSIALQFFGFENQMNTVGFGQARFRSYGDGYLVSTSLDDYEYRKILWLKVFKNCSFATANDTIKSVGIIFGVDLVIMQEIGNAKFSLSVNRVLSQSEILLAKAVDMLIRAGGVGCEFISNYNGDNFFGFNHQKGAKGFGVGEFASIII